MKRVEKYMETVSKKYDLEANLIDLNGPDDVQDSPCTFGSFCIIHEREIISHHPINNRRFQNIMNRMRIQYAI